MMIFWEFGVIKITPFVDSRNNISNPTVVPSNGKSCKENY